MTLIATSPNFPAMPPTSFAEAFKAYLISEAKSKIEEICREVFASLDASVTASTQPEIQREEMPEGVEPEDCADGEHDYVSLRKNALLKGAEMQIRNSKAYVIPRMMMLDADFGGNLNANSVCARFNFNRDIYHEYKKTTLAIYRCSKEFGGNMNLTETCKAAKICRQTLDSYMRIMKEGFNAGDK